MKIAQKCPVTLSHNPPKVSRIIGMAPYPNYLTANLAVGATYSQFHQHFTSSFCTDILLPKNYKAKQ